MAEKQKDLTGKQKRFCEEYIYDWNGTRAAKVAGYSPETAGAIASENLTKPEIQAYLKQLLDNLEQTAGISKLMVLTEHKKILHTSIAHLHETWITRKEFDQLTDYQKSSIAEIGTRIKKFTEYQGDTPVPVEVEHDPGQEAERDVELHPCPPEGRLRASERGAALLSSLVPA